MTHFHLFHRLLCFGSLLLPLAACIGATQQPKQPVMGGALDCPDWTYAHMANYRNTVLSNYGCAHANNFSKMVADPNDLIAGKGDSTPDAMRSSGIIEAYREPPAPQTSGDSEPLIQGQ